MAKKREKPIRQRSTEFTSRRYKTLEKSENVVEKSGKDISLINRSLR